MRALSPFAVAILTATAAAHADSPTCDRLRAEARSQAVVLYGPQVELEGAHVPGISDAADPTMPVAHGLQGRLSIIISPIDMLRGRAIERVASAECDRVATAARLDKVLAIGSRFGELAAARAELAYLEAHLGDLDAFIADTASRFEHQRATAIELDELRERRTEMQLHIAERREALTMLEEIDGEEPVVDLDRAVGAYRTAALTVQDRTADVRTLSPWHVAVRGGGAGADHADWFAVVQVGYAFGGIWQGDAEATARSARARELAGDVREAAVRVEQLQRAMRRSERALATELATIDDLIGKLRADRDRIDNLGETSDAAHQLHARYSIQLIELEGRRAAVAALVAARKPLAGGPP
jgi:hypothetical protein